MEKYVTYTVVVTGVIDHHYILPVIHRFLDLDEARKFIDEDIDATSASFKESPITDKTSDRVEADWGETGSLMYQITQETSKLISWELRFKDSDCPITGNFPDNTHPKFVLQSLLPLSRVNRLHSELLPVLIYKLGDSPQAYWFDIDTYINYTPKEK